MTLNVDKFFDTFNSAIAKTISDLKNEVEKLQKAAHGVTGGQAMQVVPCKLTACHGSNIEVAQSTSSYFKPTWEQHVQQARLNLEQERARIEKIHADNAIAIDNNKKIREQISKVMEAAGIPATYSCYEKVSSRSTKSHWVTKSSGFVSDLARICVIEDGYSYAIETLKSYERKINEYESAKKSQQLLEQRQKETDSKKKESLKNLAKLAAKYDCDVDANEVLSKILSKDKYLELAHHLLANRNDWNDGPQSAETGLMSFSIETQEDQLIHDELYDLIENWDGDGRVFRDCQYNYSYLFDKVPSPLMDDYSMACNLVETE